MKKNSADWFKNTQIGQYVAHKERLFFMQYEHYMRQPICIQLGELGHIMPSETTILVPDDVVMDIRSLAFESNSIDAISMAHTYEYVVEPDLVLKECYRVLRHEGKLILTGFNMQSLWGLMNRWGQDDLPERKHCFALPEFKQKIAQIGFDVEFGKLMVYVPYMDDSCRLKKWQIMEKAGDRWWPQWAAVYGMVLVKRVVGVTPLQREQNILLNEDIMPSLAKVKEEWKNNA